MNNLTFILNNQTVPPPDNWQEFEIELSYENLSPEAALNQNRLTWMGANAQLLNAQLNGGLTGGIGIYEGMPLVVQACDGETIFTGINDLTDPDIEWSCDIVAARIRDQKMDMINDLFSQVSFAALSTPAGNGFPGLINAQNQVGPYNGAWINPTTMDNGGDYVNIPYNINILPDYLQFANLVNLIYQVITQIEKVATEIVGLFTGSGVAAATIIGIGGAIGTIVTAIFWILEFSVMIIQLVQLFGNAVFELLGHVDSPVVEDLFGGRFGKPWCKIGMYVSTIANRICNYFGIPFESSIIGNYPGDPKASGYSKLAIIPVKQAWAQNYRLTGLQMTFDLLTGNPPATATRMCYDDWYNLNNGGFATGVPDGTPYDFFRWLGDVFNARLKVINDSNGNPVLHFERWDYQYDQSTYQLPNISEDAPFPQRYRTNAHELSANYIIHYKVDAGDRNTTTYYEGTSAYYNVSPKVINSQLNRTMRGLKDVELAFAQGMRKTQPTAAEDVVNVLWGILVAVPNTVIGIINDFTSLINDVLHLAGAPSIPAIPQIPAQLINPDINQLLLSHETTTVQKLVLLDGTFQGSQYAHLDPTNHSAGDMLSGGDPISARNLLKYWHYSSLAYANIPPGSYASNNYGDPYISILNAAIGSEYYNQYKIYKAQKVPLCCTDYNLIYNNNIIKDYNGNHGKVDSLKWKIFTGVATIDYRILSTYTTNLIATVQVDAGLTYNYNQL